MTTSTLPMSVQRLVVTKPGGFDRLELAHGSPKALAAGEVRVRVRAAGVNYADAMVRRGLYRTAKKYFGYPLAPGFEVAGEVTEVAPGMTRHAVGDRVIAVTLFGGYTSELTVSEDFVFPLPEGWTYAQAAAFPAVWMTAWFALCELAHPRKGARILVHSAAGGVGSMLVQLAKLAGCTVTGVVGSAHKTAAVRELGADHVIDKSTQDLWKRAEEIAPDGFDIILDANGLSTLKDSYNHLRPIGKLVVYGFHSMLPRSGGVPGRLKLFWSWLRTPRFSPFSLTTRNRGVLGFNLSFLFERTEIMERGLQQLLAWLKRGDIKAPPVTCYPFESVAEAHRDLESGQTVGKLVLTIDIKDR